MQIHRVRPGDEAFWAQAIVLLISENDRHGQIASASDLTPAFGDPSCYLFLALFEARPIGLLSAYGFPDVSAGGHLVYLYDLVVDEAHRRRGAGKALVTALVTQCRADGIRQIWVGTALDNTAARRTFEATGAVLDGETYAEYTWALGDDTEQFPQS